MLLKNDTATSVILNESEGSTQLNRIVATPRLTRLDAFYKRQLVV